MSLTMSNIQDRMYTAIRIQMIDPESSAHNQPFYSNITEFLKKTQDQIGTQMQLTIKMTIINIWSIQSRYIA